MIINFVKVYLILELGYPLKQIVYMYMYVLFDGHPYANRKPLTLICFQLYM